MKSGALGGRNERTFLSLQRNKGKHQKPLHSIVGFIPKGKTIIPLKWSYSPIYLSADSTFRTFSQNHPLLALPPLPSSVLELRPHSCLYIHPCLPRDQAIFPPVARMIRLKCTPDQVIGLFENPSTVSCCLSA